MPFSKFLIPVPIQKIFAITDGLTSKAPPRDRSTPPLDGYDQNQCKTKHARYLHEFLSNSLKQSLSEIATVSSIQHYKHRWC